MMTQPTKEELRIPSPEEAREMYPPETTDFAFAYFLDDRKSKDPALYIALMMVGSNLPDDVHQARGSFGWRGEPMMSQILLDLLRNKEIEDHNILNENEAREWADRLNVELDEPKPNMLRAFQERNGFRPRLVDENGPLLSRRDAARTKLR